MLVSKKGVLWLKSIIAQSAGVKLRFGIFKRFTYDRQTKVREGETSYTVGGGRHGGGSPLSELHLTHPDKSDKVRICAGMSDDALDYVAAVIRREAAKV